MVTERVALVSIEWLETIYTHNRMFRIPPNIIKGILNLDFNACVAVGCERNLAFDSINDEFPDSFVDKRSGTSAVGALPCGSKYIGFCGWNRVFIADPKITDDFRVKYRRYQYRGHPTGYVITDLHIYSTDCTEDMGEIPRMNVQPL